jgi:hypothetical protein
MSKTSPEERLLKAIFSTETDNYPDTMAEKVGYAEHCLASSLEGISKGLIRLNILYNMLRAAEKDGENTLPDIITNAGARMALTHLLPVERDIKEIAETLMGIYKATKIDAPEKKTDGQA